MTTLSLRHFSRVLACVAFAGSAMAQDVRAPDRLCSVPVATVASEATLPHLATALENTGRIRILAIGSSSTFGLGASSPTLAYPVLFQSLLERQVGGHAVSVTNRGVNGEKAAETALRMRREVAELSPHLVLWQVGTNDGLADVPLAEFRATLVDTIRWLRARNIDVALVGLQYTLKLRDHAHYQAIKQVVREVAVAENVLHVRRYEAMQHLALQHANVGYLASDQFHLNDLGYRCMAEHVATAVVTNLFRIPRKDVVTAGAPVGRTGSR